MIKYRCIKLSVHCDIQLLIKKACFYGFMDYAGTDVQELQFSETMKQFIDTAVSRRSQIRNVRTDRKLLAFQE